MRSKALLVANIFSSLWSGSLLIYFGSFLLNGGWDMLVSANALSEIFTDLVDGANAMVIIDVVMALIMIHMVLFTLGAVLGWIGYSLKKSSNAKAAAILYLLATLLFPIFIFILLPTIVLGFVGQKNQKKLQIQQE